MMRFWIGVLLLGALAGCQGKPGYEYRLGDVLLEQDFSQSFAWERYQSTERGTDARVEAGVYRMQARGSGYIWGLNAAMHDNVMIEVQAQQQSDDSNNAYGVMCRADPSNDGDGYYFLISGDGYWSIRRSSGDGVEPLVEFTRSDAIRRDQSLNTLRAICVDDYLALYVNDQFVGEARDRLYSAGFAGMIVAAAGDDGEANVDIAFDNLRIVEARIVLPGF